MSAPQTTEPAPPNATPAILDAVNITKQFGGLTAVSDVSFTLPERSIVSIIGPNGAGKTTFFNMLTGFYRPTIGRITFGGRNITGARPDLVMKAGMARTFQNIRLFSTMTAMENVLIGEHSRMGRAWVALREDEIAAVAMGVPAVKTKLMAYASGAAFGGISGAFLASLLNTVNADQFQFFFSILVLAMIILGGLGSIWGVVVGAIVLSILNNYLIPDVINEVPAKVGLEFDMTQITFAIYGFLLLLMMILRPQGLLPERRHKMELAEHAETSDETLYTARA
jgi:ABC-type branched-subunit amino acid transport system permease subunit